MNDRTESLRKQLLQAANEPEPTVDGLLECPVFLVDPFSVIGSIHSEFVASVVKGLVAVIDDTPSGSSVYGAPRWTSKQFQEQAQQYPGAIAIDFSFGLQGSARIAQLIEEAGVEHVDCVLVLGQLGRFAVYAPANDYRRQTLEHLDSFLKLADRLDDDYSRATLYANLLFRIRYDRSYLAQIRETPSSEYFSGDAAANTFRLGRREHYVDCGAYQGTIVQKFLEATEHQYASITAFEPDPSNYEKLAQLSVSAVRSFRPINKAVSSEVGELRFRASGNMGSHASANGNIVVGVAPLDDEVEQASFLKLDVEGFEPQALQGAARLLRTCRPRIAAAVYHYPLDLLKVVEQIDRHAGEGYHYRLRQHYANFYYDLVLYASPVAGVDAPGWVV